MVWFWQLKTNPVTEFVQLPSWYKISQVSVYSINFLFTLRVLQWEDSRACRKKIWRLEASERNGQSQVLKESTYVCDWLHYSVLRKHVVNRIFWCFLECKHNCKLQPLPNLFCQYPTVVTKGAFDCMRKWMCGVRAWEKCQLRESAALMCPPTHTVCICHFFLGLTAYFWGNGKLIQKTWRLFWTSNILFIAWILESYSLLEWLYDSLVDLVVLSSSGRQGSWQRR